VLALQAQPSGTGNADKGDPSIWGSAPVVIGFIVLGLAVFAFLVWFVLRSRDPSPSGAAAARSPDAAPAEPAAPEPATAAPSATAAPPDTAGPAAPVAEDLTVLVFEHTHGAEHAFADVRGRGEAAWIADVAFVECHRHGRLVVRGTFAGHYLDEEDVGEAARRGTVAGEVAESLVALAFEPPGPAEETSAIVAIAPRDDADAIVTAFGERPTRLTRRRLSSADVAAIEAVAAGAPPAARVDGPGPGPT